MTSSRFWVRPFVLGVVVGSVGGMALGAAVSQPMVDQGRRLVARLLPQGRGDQPIRFDLLVQ